MSNDFFGVVALLMILGIGAVAFGGVYANGGAPERVDNETVTVDYSSPQSVQQSGLSYDDRVTVRNGSGAVLDAETDYQWNATSGEVTFLNTSATTSGGDATITYQYRAETDTHQSTGRVISMLSTFLTWGLILLAGGYVFREVVN